MATLSEIVQDKANRLESVPNKFNSAVSKSQKEIFEEILTLLDGLEKKDGQIVLSASNIKEVEDIIEELKKVFYGSDYVEAVRDFAKEFDTQGEITRDLFEKSFKNAEFTELSTAVLKSEKKTAVESLLGSSIDKEFFNPIKSTIQDAVNSGSSLKDLISNIRTITEGDEERLGKLSRYANQISSDAFATSDRAYTNSIAKEIDAEWYRYVGGLLDDSRDFCVHRNNNYYHKKEVEGWADENWQGKSIETDASTIFIWLGGYNCKHSLIPVPLSQVPPEVVERNIQSGNFIQD